MSLGRTMRSHLAAAKQGLALAAALVAWVTDFMRCDGSWSIDRVARSGAGARRSGS
jgi:hypothetical protein